MSTLGVEGSAKLIPTNYGYHIGQYSILGSSINWIKSQKFIKSQNVEEHKKHIWEVFRRIQEYGFKVSFDKWDFSMDKIEYLGKILDQKGRKLNPNRIEAIKICLGQII